MAAIREALKTKGFDVSRMVQLRSEIRDERDAALARVKELEARNLFLEEFTPKTNLGLTATIAQLQFERDALKLERDEAQQWIDSEPDWKSQLIAMHEATKKELSKATSEVEQLRKDGERLEAERFAIKTALGLHQLPYDPDLGVSVVAHLELAAQDAARLNWLERRSHEEISEIQWLNNIRSAIDAAMSQGKEQG